MHLTSVSKHDQEDKCERAEGEIGTDDSSVYVCAEWYALEVDRCLRETRACGVYILARHECCCVLVCMSGVCGAWPKWSGGGGMEWECRCSKASEVRSVHVWMVMEMGAAGLRE